MNFYLIRKSISFFEIEMLDKYKKIIIKLIIKTTKSFNVFFQIKFIFFKKQTKKKHNISLNL